ncbi:acidic phospholipase A2-like [Lytechinus variegatus]|uniref:acidic phospholipase A2-like n=1 Tax=Lytechinus variegatus TaxID=7654 RepID=UPI001BB171CD|nr:acidic phospholipase A2-like [Lytechinus variegatus]
MVSLSLVVFIIFSSLYHVDAAPTKEKRSLLQLNTVISCYTGKSGFDFNGYGCWCGLGGSGNPVDDVDRCCMAHDNCYQALQDEGCGLYFTSYEYSEQNCGSRNGSITCGGSPADPETECSFKLCECDRRIASCLRQHTYHDVFADFPKSFCDPRLAHTGTVIVDETPNSPDVVPIAGDARGAYQQVPAGILGQIPPRN